MSEQPPKPAKGKKSRRGRRLFAWFAATIVVVACGGLIVFYRLIGDVTVIGEAVSVFPPLVWLFPLSILALPVLFGRSIRAALLAVAAILAFFFSTEDWQSLFNLGNNERRYKSIRIITWNIAGRSDWKEMLDELEPLQPDVLFLQETPDGDSSLTTKSLNDYWAGFSWNDQGDCGILSRYPLTPLQSTKLGPWDKPALALAEMPRINKTTGTVVLCNVRLMLPGAAVSADRWLQNWEERGQQHQTRIDQYHALANLITQLKEEHNGEVILAGDFNARGGSHSLRVLQKAGLRDAWFTSGSGWGATILSEFPMARIDQVWLSKKVRPVVSKVHRGEVSDHRMVITDFRIAP